MYRSFERSVLSNENKKQNLFTLSSQPCSAAVAGNPSCRWRFPIPLMPPFYKIDFSDVPSVIATFLLGPVSGISVEVIKILIKPDHCGDEHYVCR